MELSQLNKLPIINENTNTSYKPYEWASYIKWTYYNKHKDYIPNKEKYHETKKLNKNIDIIDKYILLSGMNRSRVKSHILDIIKKYDFDDGFVISPLDKHERDYSKYIFLQENIYHNDKYETSLDNFITNMDPDMKNIIIFDDSHKSLFILKNMINKIKEKGKNITIIVNVQQNINQTLVSNLFDVFDYIFLFDFNDIISYYGTNAVFSGILNLPFNNELLVKIFDNITKDSSLVLEKDTSIVYIDDGKNIINKSITFERDLLFSLFYTIII
jgi:hypothetical protein